MTDPVQARRRGGQGSAWATARPRPAPLRLGRGRCRTSGPRRTPLPVGADNRPGPRGSRLTPKLTPKRADFRGRRQTAVDKMQRFSSPHGQQWTDLDELPNSCLLASCGHFPRDSAKVGVIDLPLTGYLTGYAPAAASSVPALGGVRIASSCAARRFPSCGSTAR